MAAGATLDAIWGDEAGVAEGALWGLAAGSTVKAIGASKVLSLDNKKKYLGFIWGDAQLHHSQKAREMTSAANLIMELLEVILKLLVFNY